MAGEKLENELAKRSEIKYNELEQALRSKEWDNVINMLKAQSPVTYEFSESQSNTLLESYVGVISLEIVKTLLQQVSDVNKTQETLLSKLIRVVANSVQINDEQVKILAFLFSKPDIDLAQLVDDQKNHKTIDTVLLVLIGKIGRSLGINPAQEVVLKQLLLIPGIELSHVAWSIRTVIHPSLRYDLAVDFFKILHARDPKNSSRHELFEAIVRGGRISSNDLKQLCSEPGIISTPDVNRVLESIICTRIDKGDLFILENLRVLCFLKGDKQPNKETLGIVLVEALSRGYMQFAQDIFSKCADKIAEEYRLEALAILFEYHDSNPSWDYFFNSANPCKITSSEVSATLKKIITNTSWNTAGIDYLSSQKGSFQPDPESLGMTLVAAASRDPALAIKLFLMHGSNDAILKEHRQKALNILFSSSVFNKSNLEHLCHLNSSSHLTALELSTVLQHLLDNLPADAPDWKAIEFLCSLPAPGQPDMNSLNHALIKAAPKNPQLAIKLFKLIGSNNPYRQEVLTLLFSQSLSTQACRELFDKNSQAAPTPAEVDMILETLITSDRFDHFDSTVAADWKGLESLCFLSKPSRDVLGRVIKKALSASNSEFVKELVKLKTLHELDAATRATVFPQIISKDVEAIKALLPYLLVNHTTANAVVKTLIQQYESGFIFLGQVTDFWKMVTELSTNFFDNLDKDTAEYILNKNVIHKNWKAVAVLIKNKHLYNPPDQSILAALNGLLHHISDENTTVDMSQFIINSVRSLPRLDETITKSQPGMLFHKLVGQIKKSRHVAKLSVAPQPQEIEPSNPIEYSIDVLNTCEACVKKLLLTTQKYQDSLSQEKNTEIHAILKKLIAVVSAPGVERDPKTLEQFYLILDAKNDTHSCKNIDLIGMNKERSTLRFIAGIAIIALVVISGILPGLIGIAIVAKLTGKSPLGLFKPLNTEFLETVEKIDKERTDVFHSNEDQNNMDPL